MSAEGKKTDGKVTKAGPGRPPGSKNKIPGQIKEMVIASLEMAGGVVFLEKCSRTHTNAYLALLGKVLPLQLQGDPENPLLMELMTTYRLPENDR